MARTLTTAERQLGICTDRFITYFFLCGVCWKIHHPTDLSRLTTSACDADGCMGTLYTIKQLSNGSESEHQPKSYHMCVSRRQFSICFLVQGSMSNYSIGGIQEGMTLDLLRHTKLKVMMHSLTPRYQCPIFMMARGGEQYKWVWSGGAVENGQYKMWMSVNCTSSLYLCH
jgi:hypothetical protein